MDFKTFNKRLHVRKIVRIWHAFRFEKVVKQSPPPVQAKCKRISIPAHTQGERHIYTQRYTDTERDTHINTHTQTHTYLLVKLILTKIKFLVSRGWDLSCAYRRCLCVMNWWRSGRTLPLIPPVRGNVSVQAVNNEMVCWQATLLFLTTSNEIVWTFFLHQSK